MPYACVDKRILWPVIYYTNSLTSKTISGPGLPSMTWSYQFDAPNGSFDTCTNCPVTEAVNVTDPEGNVSRHVFGNQYFINEGKPLEIYEGWSSGSYLRRTSISYRTWQSTDPYPEQFGVSDEIYGDGGSDLKTKPEETRTINQQGVDFTWRADAFDSLARPTVVTKFSGSNTRTETTTYFDNDAKWVIGQIGEVTSGGKSMVKNLFDSTTLLPSSTSSFGIVQKSMTYNSDGVDHQERRRQDCDKDLHLRCERAPVQNDRTRDGWDDSTIRLV